MSLPWRVAAYRAYRAGYIDGMWDLLYVHTDTPEVPQPGASANEIIKKAYTLSLWANAAQSPDYDYAGHH